MKKNVIYILCDQLRASSLSCYGETNINTPNIDLLAREEVLFENAVASTPLCTPARGNMMTGRRVFEHTASGHDFHLTHDIPFISDVLMIIILKLCILGNGIWMVVISQFTTKRVDL